jgi:cytosine deaminase
VYLQGVCNLFLPLWSEPGIADEFAKVAAANNDNEGGDSVLLGAYCGVVGRGETNNDEARKHFRNLFSYANKYAMNIDVHIDETNDPNCCAVLSCLEAFLNDDDGNLGAFKNIRSLSLSHVCSLSLQSKATIDRVIELAKKIDEKTSTRVSFIVNPLTNLGLQDRRGTTDGVGVLIDKNIPHTPRWRGIAPIQELESAGINVCTGTDNVRDYWNPYADYDGIATLKATFEVAQLNTVPNEGYWTKLIAANSAKAMFTKLPAPKIGLIRKGYRADFILLPQARSFYELFSRPSQHERIVFRKGRPTLDCVLPDFSELDETVAVRTDAAPFLDDDVEIKRGATSLASSFSKRKNREEDAEV